ncbi:MAG: FMN-binding negative transcriptional regulator [Acidobacteriia bacterium]|nr:FMN-binding negative transcriptional regulator [Terriglobia bacterium]
MYCPVQFKEERLPVLHELMARHPLATLVTLTPQGLEATHLPLLHDAGAGPFGTLRGHMARANPQWRQMSEGVRALAIFHGPQHYISPSWYPSRLEHGRVVPTWNYVVVHAQGPVRVIPDKDWLRRNVTELTAAQEAGFANPWRVEDAPEAFIDGQANAIVGIEMTIETLEGKWKASQNRPEADRVGVIAGLRALGTPESERMAEVVRVANGLSPRA